MREEGGREGGREGGGREGGRREGGREGGRREGVSIDTKIITFCGT